MLYDLKFYVLINVVADMIEVSLLCTIMHADILAKGDV